MFKATLLLVTCLAGLSLQATIGKTAADLEIINGQEAAPHAYPYMAKLKLVFTNYYQQAGQDCGGSLISKNFVLTAAHCIFGSEGFTLQYADVILGAHDVSVQEPGSVRLRSTEISYHAGFNGQTLDNDICLIKLPQPVNPSATIKILQLPSRRDVNANYVGQVATLTGWGKIATNNPVLPNRLRVVRIPVTQSSVCANVFPGYNLEKKICTAGAYPNRGGCQGDSGGPLVINGVQVGIVSFGLPDCEVAYGPGVFTQVSSHLDWIAANSDANIRY